jgi:hypothetical protein
MPAKAPLWEKPWHPVFCKKGELLFTLHITGNAALGLPYIVLLRITSKLHGFGQFSMHPYRNHQLSVMFFRNQTGLVLVVGTPTH